jgi:plastocyanin
MKTRVLCLFLGAAAVTGIAQNPPAPSVDRVGFPTGFQNWPVLYVFDRPDNRQIRTIYGNGVATQVDRGKQHNFPYGSVLVMEVVAALRDAAGNVVLDANGRFQRDPTSAPTIFVSRKEPGYGADYGPNRTGEWEYVSYRTDGSFATAPSGSFACASCHLQMGPENDWTARVSELYLKGNNGAVPDVSMKAYKYLPGVLRVKAGTLVTFVNDDVIDHTLTTPDRTGDSGRLGTGRSFQVKFSNPGTFDFICTLHQNMRMQVIVEP